MAVWLFCAVALALSGLSAGVSVCIRANARSCGECIQVSKSCGWCSDESFPWSTGSKALRCDDVQSLLARNCPPGKIVNPLGIVNIEKNLPESDHKKSSPEKLTAEQIIQIQPQKFNITLRPGEPQTFSLKFKRAEDYPIDLYYLIDLSSSMKDDLENVKNLGTGLVAEMQKITSDFRIGFGSIVKTAQTPPGDPCPWTPNCPGPFIFKNVLKLTDKGEEFTRLVSQLQISDSLDSALGGSNAIMQVALCEEQIGWRDATRLLVLSTDAALHLAGLWTPLPLPQGGQCQLENDTYTSDGQDHPSLIQLLRTVSKHNIQTIFAVTENVLPAYEELKNRFPKFSVGSLTSNSSNVIQLIVDAYNSLSSEVVLENSRLPEGVFISYKSLCKNGVEEIGENARKCSNISISDEVSFEITITAQKCPQLGKAEVIKIYPLGFSEGVEVALNFICECQCSAQGEPQNEKCNAAGTLECGACNCDPGWIGAQCDCDMSTMDNADALMMCRRSSDLDVCSNNGDCVCGICECKKRENPEERYSGQFCECDNFSCDRSGNRLCAGHGRCECRMCVCDANWTGSACDCSLDLTSCLAKNGQVCNGRGTCECGICKCTDPKFQGPTCELCPTCPGTCTLQKDCVQCRTFGTGLKVGSCESDCNYFNMIKVTDSDKLPQPSDNSRPLTHCKERDENDCWYYFTYSVHEDGTKEVHVVQTQDCPKVSLFDYLG